MAYSTPKLTSESKLEGLFAPKALELICEEVFLVLPQRFGVTPHPPLVTVADLVAASGLPLDDVIRRLKEILKMSQELEIEPKELAGLLAQADWQQRLVLLDVRADWEFATAHIAGSLLLAELDFPALLAQLKAEAPTPRTVITICHHGVRSYSAAMYLKGQGLTAVHSLAGGVDAWARLVDPKLARY